MLRGRKAGGVALEALALSGFYAILAATIDVSMLIQILNGVFVGVVVAVTPPYWQLIWEQVSIAKPYDREHQFTLGISLLWAGAIMNRLISIGARTIQGDVALISDTQFTAATIYVLIIAGLLQITAISQSDPYTSRDRTFLIRSAVAGAIVAVVLILAQAWGTGEITLPF